MNTYILATVGTSLLTNLRHELGLSEDEIPAKQCALDFLGRHEPQDRACGAEINSISHLLRGQKLSTGVVEPPVEITLLVSDTEEGRWVGDVLETYFGGMKREVEGVKVVPVGGLIGSEPGRFATEGLRNLVKLAAAHLSKARRHAPDALCILDTTGGYKAQVAFASLLGQVLKVPVVYLFEQFPRCIELPPLPVDFDRNLWIEHYGLLKRLSEEGCVPAKEVNLEDMDPRLRGLLDREDIDGTELVALSPMLELMHQGFMLSEPVGLERPPNSDVPPEKRLHLVEKELPHAPKGTREICERLAKLDWVSGVKNGAYVNTQERWRVRRGGTTDIGEIVCVHGDGDMGVEIHLRTTARTNPQRQWCLEWLKDFGLK